ncbi:hypothetical protein EXIGLDRAFT_829502 [Exidia glandulosa HHB12029]|uniref:G-protein coupled receptors family 1 profile domain-containing protein n=1 Tax=Exidia glandulosa HHB12029 TaxID=1314781 RepID=A0A165PKV9_EXIGL|nr:hypothetical protein EXIGLDRAFT_829502 [Exidia glandulosa HHB12029]
MPSLLYTRADDPTAAAPNIAQIVLPPGFTLDQFFDLQNKASQYRIQHVSRPSFSISSSFSISDSVFISVSISVSEQRHIGICVAVAFGIICWDYIVLFMDEIRLYRTITIPAVKKLWKTPATWAFIVLRYAAFLATFPALFFTSIQSRHCQAAVVTSCVGVLLVVGCAGIIFCNRVIAIWSNNRIIIGVLAALWTGMMGCWIAVAVNYNAITGPSTPLGSNCQMQPIVSWAPISFASSVLFDLSILILSIYKLHANSSGLGLQSATARQIANDNITYFVLTAATNIAVLSVQALGNSYAMIKPTAVPFSTVVTVAMAQRVYLNLKLFHLRNERAQADLPAMFPFNGTGSGSSRRNGGAAEVVAVASPRVPASAYLAGLGSGEKLVEKDAVDGLPGLSERQELSARRGNDEKV